MNTLTQKEALRLLAIVADHEADPSAARQAQAQLAELIKLLIPL